MFWFAWLKMPRWGPWAGPDGGVVPAAGFVAGAADDDDGDEGDEGDVVAVDVAAAAADDGVDTGGCIGEVLLLLMLLLVGEAPGDGGAAGPLVAAAGPSLGLRPASAGGFDDESAPPLVLKARSWNNADRRKLVEASAASAADRRRPTKATGSRGDGSDRRGGHRRAAARPTSEKRIM